jgi:hypothetical protein
VLTARITHAANKILNFRDNQGFAGQILFITAAAYSGSHSTNWHLNGVN